MQSTSKPMSDATRNLLAAADDRYRTLFNSIDEGVCVFEVLFDANGRPFDYRFLDTNAVFEQQTGLHEPVGKTARELVPNLEDHWVEVYGRVALTGKPERFSNGSEAMGRWFDVYAFRLGGDESRQVALLFKDISAHKRAEDALRESEQRFRRLADHAPVVVWVTESDGRCSYLNRKWYELTGQTPDQALGFGWMDAVHPEDREHVRHTFVTANARRETFSSEYRLCRRDGSCAWMLDSAAPRLGPNGEYLGYVGSVVDISERRERETELRTENHMKDQFLAILSHELRTPLNAVVGWAHMLRTNTVHPDARDRALESLERNARAQMQLVDDLLDISRIISGKLPLVTDAIELTSVLAAAIETIRPAAAAKGVTLLLTQHGPTPVTAFGDAVRLRQIVWNLLSNALKFTPAAGRIDVELASAPGEATIVVQDTGEGISPAFLPFVFERFLQGDASVTRRHGGLGLGLAIARHLAEAHGGSLTGASDGAGRGARFTLRLPLPSSSGPLASAVVKPSPSAG